MVIVEQEAVVFLKGVLDKHNTPSPPGGIRIGVKAGGCSGLSYFWEPCLKPQQNDHVIEMGLIRIFIDPKSSAILQGTNISYSPDLLQGPLIFNNPNAGPSCGCGTSFQLKEKTPK